MCRPQVREEAAGLAQQMQQLAAQLAERDQTIEMQAAAARLETAKNAEAQALAQMEKAALLRQVRRSILLTRHSPT
jgi:hypothetical protein